MYRQLYNKMLYKSIFFLFFSSGFVFLRLICPAIVNPRIFNIIAGELWLGNSICSVFIKQASATFWKTLNIEMYTSNTWSISADPPCPIASRTLTLVAKAVQNLANLVEFGAKVK